jgi:hypothetical protein
MFDLGLFCSLSTILESMESPNEEIEQWEERTSGNGEKFEPAS